MVCNPWALHHISHCLSERKALDVNCWLTFSGLGMFLFTEHPLKAGQPYSPKSHCTSVLITFHRIHVMLTLSALLFMFFSSPLQRSMHQRLISMYIKIPVPIRVALGGWDALQCTRLDSDLALPPDSSSRSFWHRGCTHCIGPHQDARTSVNVFSDSVCRHLVHLGVAVGQSPQQKHKEASVSQLAQLPLMLASGPCLMMMHSAMILQQHLYPACWDNAFRSAKLEDVPWKVASTD